MAGMTLFMRVSRNSARCYYDKARCYYDNPRCYYDEGAMLLRWIKRVIHSLKYRSIAALFIDLNVARLPVVGFFC